MPYQIKRAVAIRRYDLLVNGIVVKSGDTKGEVESFARDMVVKGLLKEAA